MSNCTAPRKVTREEAHAIRDAHAAGIPVKAIELQESTRVLSRKRDQRMRLPALTPFARERVNAVLLFKLGLAIGRAQR